MAESTKLVIRYRTTADGTTTHTWKYAKPSAGVEAVSALITATINNGSLFQLVPAEVIEAKEVTTTETPYDLSTLTGTAKSYVASPETIARLKEAETTETTTLASGSDLTAELARIRAAQN